MSDPEDPIYVDPYRELEESAADDESNYVQPYARFKPELEEIPTEIAALPEYGRLPSAQSADEQAANNKYVQQEKEFLTFGGRPRSQLQILPGFGLLGVLGGILSLMDGYLPGVGYVIGGGFVLLLGLYVQGGQKWTAKFDRNGVHLKALGSTQTLPWPKEKSEFFVQKLQPATVGGKTYYALHLRDSGGNVHAISGIKADCKSATAKQELLDELDLIWEWAQTRRYAGKYAQPAAPATADLASPEQETAPPSTEAEAYDVQQSEIYLGSTPPSRSSWRTRFLGAGIFASFLGICLLFFLGLVNAYTVSLFLLGLFLIRVVYRSYFCRTRLNETGIWVSNMRGLKNYPWPVTRTGIFPEIDASSNYYQGHLCIQNEHGFAVTLPGVKESGKDREEILQELLAQRDSLWKWGAVKGYAWETMRAPQTDLGARRRLLRPDEEFISRLLYFVLLLAVGVNFSLARWLWFDGQTTGAYWLSIFALILLLLMLNRMLTRTQLDENGIHVRNLFGPRNVPWPQSRTGFFFKHSLWSGLLPSTSGSNSQFATLWVVRPNGRAQKLRGLYLSRVALKDLEIVANTELDSIWDWAVARGYTHETGQYVKLRGLAAQESRAAFERKAARRREAL